MIESQNVFKQPTPERRTLKKDLELIRHKYGKQALEVAGVAVGMAAAGAIGYAAGDHLSSSDTANAEYTTHTVVNGETLSSIANDFYPDSDDIREEVYEIANNPANLNVFEDDILTPGEVLEVRIPESPSDN